MSKQQNANSKKSEEVILYHGTYIDNLKKILKNGIQPGNKLRKQNWEHTEFPTREGLVYLTLAHAIAYAVSASPKDHRVGDGFLIFECKVPEEKIYPDEDYLGQLAAGYMGQLDPEHQASDECNPLLHQQIWRRSLMNMGNCCTTFIASEQITRYAVVTDKSVIADGVDLPLGILPFLLTGKQNLYQLQWIFDEGVDYRNREYFYPEGKISGEKIAYIKEGDGTDWDKRYRIAIAQSLGNKSGGTRQEWLGGSPNRSKLSRSGINVVEVR